jgi:hypothetical protein
VHRGEEWILADFTFMNSADNFIINLIITLDFEVYDNH